MNDVAAMAERLRGLVEDDSPWPHGIIDDFLPQWALNNVLATVAAMNTAADFVKAKPSLAVLDLLQSSEVVNAIRSRFSFEGARGSAIDIVYSRRGVQAHSDRADKPWSGIVYLTGDPKGTELYGTDGLLAKVVEWKPNRLVCWGHRPHREQHAVPVSAGRVVLRWWLLKNKVA